MSRDGQRISPGSILGPLIFHLYINDRPQHIKAVHILLYADDTILGWHADTSCDLNVKINNVSVKGSLYGVKETL